VRAQIDTSASTSSRLELAGLTTLRIAYGLVILTHGLPKALHLPHGTMGDPFVSTTHLIANLLGPTLAVPLAWAVTVLETLGAAMLAVGFLTRLVAAAFVAEMIGIAFAMGPAWAWIDRGIEYPVMLAVMAMYFVIRGAGLWSVDGLLANRASRV
jgi:putative oxidoreductase